MDHGIDSNCMWMLPVTLMSKLSFVITVCSLPLASVSCAPFTRADPVFRSTLISGCSKHSRHCSTHSMRPAISFTKTPATIFNSSLFTSRAVLLLHGIECRIQLILCVQNRLHNGLAICQLKRYYMLHCCAFKKSKPAGYT